MRKHKDGYTLAMDAIRHAKRACKLMERVIAIIEKEQELRRKNNETKNT